MDFTRKGFKFKYVAKQELHSPLPDITLYNFLKEAYYLSNGHGKKFKRTKPKKAKKTKSIL